MNSTLMQCKMTAPASMDGPWHGGMCTRNSKCTTLQAFTKEWNSMSANTTYVHERRI